MYNIENYFANDRESLVGLFSNNSKAYQLAMQKAQYLLKFSLELIGGVIFKNLNKSQFIHFFLLSSSFHNRESKNFKTLEVIDFPISNAPSMSLDL